MRRVAAVMWLSVLALCWVPAVHAQLGSLSRQRGLHMLNSVRHDLRDHYFDSTYRGVNMDSVFDATEQYIRSTAASLGDVFGSIAVSLLPLHDSHLFFVPPTRASRVEYGLDFAAFGDSCFITSVEPWSDAARQGLTRGDPVLMIDGLEPNRDNLWWIWYVLGVLDPRPVLHLRIRHGDTTADLTVQARIGPPRAIQDLTGRDGGLGIHDYIVGIENRDQELHDAFAVVDSVGILRLRHFAWETDDIDRRMRDVHDLKGLILDLRGNPGGAVRGLLHTVGLLFGDSIHVATVVSRTGSDVAWAEPDEHPFAGSIVVLIDAESASAAEILARVVQLEHRGTVIGDRSSGAVMTSQFHVHEMGASRVVVYGLSVTVSDVIMSDGHRLEWEGVTPDYIVIPTSDDLKSRRDPALARALATLGVRATPTQAGRLLPIR